MKHSPHTEDRKHITQQYEIANYFIKYYRVLIENKE